MSDIFTMISGKNDVSNRICSVAYTLNNEQPVACTYIGAQPLFYMDCEMDYEDDETAILDMGDFALLEKELSDLKHEILSLDRFSQEFNEEPEIRFEEFLENQDMFHVNQPKATLNNEIELVNVLKQSRIAAEYLSFARQNQVELIYSQQVIDAEYNRETGIIAINPNISLAEQLLLCTRELRRHWQHRQGALINPLLFSPEKAVLINRVQSADLAISMVRTAWELQLSGEKSAWERVENSSLSDIGHALAREAYLDFRTLNNGEAMAAMFESWFLSERCQKEDRKLIQKMLSNYGGFAFDLDGQQENVTPTLIAAIGEMPFGKNYLAQHALTIMEDPIFADVRDRSNANFLWFIKFERSFKETEQELQLDGEQLTDGELSPHAQHTLGDNHEQSNTVIDLFQTSSNQQSSQGQEIGATGDKSQESGGRLSPKSNDKRKNNDSAEIIYLKRWSGD